MLLMQGAPGCHKVYAYYVGKGLFCIALTKALNLLWVARRGLSLRRSLRFLFPERSPLSLASPPSSWVA